MRLVECRAKVIIYYEKEAKNMKLMKVFSEVRYERSFLFDDPKVKNDIYKELKKEFQLAEHDDNKVIVFFNLKNKTKLLIYHDRILIDIDEPSDLNKIKSVGGTFTPFIMKRMDLVKTERVGVRCQYVDEVNGPDFNEKVISSLFHPALAKYINDHNNTLDVAPKIGYSININHEFALNVGIGLQNFATGRGAVSNNSNEFKLLNIENSTPIIDLDVYTNLPKETSQLNGVMKASSDFIEKYSNTIWSKVK